MYVHRVGAIEIAKDLVGEQALGRQEGLPPAQEFLELAPRDPQSRQHPGFGVVFERQAQWPQTQLYGFRRRAHLVEDERRALAFVRRLAFDIEELGAVRHRIEDDHKIQIRRQLQRKLRLPAINLRTERRLSAEQRQERTFSEHRWEWWHRLWPCQPRRAA